MANTNGWGDGAANNAIGWGQGANNAIGWGDIHADSWAGATDIVGTTTPPVVNLLLDDYPNSAVAYSLRKLRTAYTGSAIRVRRSSDNAEQDINFVGGDLDTASLLTFCGAGNGFITTWYDQSTNANNATQATAASQAQIVSAGALILDANTSKITSTWTADSYALINGVNPNTRYLSVSVNTRLTINDQILHLGNTTNPGTVNGQQSLRWRGIDGLIQSFRHTQSSHGLITTNGSYIIMSEKDSNNLKSVYINGFVNSSGTEVPADGTLMNQFGRSSTQSTTAQYQEFIYWDSEQSANRIGIETDINTYWNAY
jgi:hypothetical protein